METSITLFDIHVASRAFFTIALHPFPGLFVVRVAMLALRLILGAGKTLVPRYLVGEAHLKFALIASHVWIWIFALFVDLAAVAGAV